MRGFQATPGGPSGAGVPRHSQLPGPHPAGSVEEAQARERGPTGTWGISSGPPSSLLCAWETRNGTQQFGIVEKIQTEEINTSEIQHTCCHHHHVIHESRLSVAFWK